MGTPVSLPYIRSAEHRGTSYAVLLPPVMRFNTTVVPDRLKHLAVAMDADPTADAAIQRVFELNRLCGIGTLRDYRVTDDVIVPMAAKAMEDGCRLCKQRVTE